MGLKITRSLRIVAICVAGVALSAGLATSTTRTTSASTWQTTVRSIVGTWTGTSTCVGNRPACKNETVVYRIIPVDGHPHQVRLLADKIIEGKRVAMGALVFEVNEPEGTLRGEFQRGQTHGVWSFTVAGDAMNGTLLLLPDGTVGRDVKVRRAREDDVPAAPPMSDYEE
jgi:hypothetical protein